MNEISQLNQQCLEEQQRLEDVNELLRTETETLKEKRELLWAHEFLCPIKMELMKDPVVAADGHSYERTAIEEWLRNHNNSPMTNKALPHKKLVPNIALGTLIKDTTQVHPDEADPVIETLLACVKQQIQTAAKVPQMDVVGKLKRFQHYFERFQRSDVPKYSFREELKFGGVVKKCNRIISNYKATLEVEWVPRLLIKSKDRTRQIKIETIKGGALKNNQKEFKFDSQTECLREPKDKWDPYTGKLIFATDTDRQKFETRMRELGAKLA